MANACVPFGDACTDYWSAEACCDEGSGVTCITPMDNSQATCQTCLNRGDACGADSHCCTGCCHDDVCVTYDVFCLSSGSNSSWNFGADSVFLAAFFIFVMWFCFCVALTGGYQIIKRIIGINGTRGRVEKESKLDDEVSLIIID